MHARSRAAQNVFHVQRYEGLVFDEKNELASEWLCLVSAGHAIGPSATEQPVEHANGDNRVIN